VEIADAFGEIHAVASILEEYKIQFLDRVQVLTYHHDILKL
jgi:hypothetical protein